VCGKGAGGAGGEAGWGEQGPGRQQRPSAAQRAGSAREFGRQGLTCEHSLPKAHPPPSPS
jgi:hypothetical protein